MLNKNRRIAAWSMQSLAALIFAQTLFFKFTGAEESKYIFETLGMEPWGRIGSGIVELIVVGLLLTPRLASVGAFAGLGVITGAILSHLTKLGIVVKDDGGLLFALALIVFACCSGVLWLRRAELLRILGLSRLIGASAV